MSEFFDLVQTCGGTNLPGVKVPTYWVATSDIDTFPGYLITTDQGDSVKLDGDIVLIALAKFKQINVLTDSGEVKDTMVGNVGSKAFESTFDAMIPKTDPSSGEFFEKNANECLIVIVCDKNGFNRVFGNVDVPAKLETAEGAGGKTTGDDNGWTFQLKSTIGRIAPYYDGVIDVDDLT